MEEKYILAVDHGTSGVKNSIITVTGKLIDFAFKSTPIYYKEDGGVEQDPDEWWEAFIVTTKELLEKCKINKNDIVAISVSSTFSSTVAVDKNGKHLMPALTWLDARGSPIVRRVMSGIPSIEGYSVNNIIKWLPLTGGAPTLSGKDDIAHVLFIKENLPEIYNKTDKFLGSKDYFNLRLTGKSYASFDSITLFWITDNRNPNKIKYSNKLIKSLGLDKEKFPPIVRSDAIIGTISKDVAKKLQLPERVKVVAGSPDLQSAAIGSGAVEDFKAHIYVGTSSWLLAHVPFKKTDVLHNIAALPSSISGRYLCMNEQDIAGGALDFLINNIIFHNKKLNSTEVSDKYRLIDEIVAQVPAGSNGVIFTPWLNGERTPVDNEKIRGSFTNLSITNNINDMARSVFEGVALNSRWVMVYVEKLLKRKLDKINIIGGGAKSSVWCQIFADVLNREIHQVKDPIVANSRGAAFIASVGLGYISYQDIPNLVKIEKVFTPNQDNVPLYDNIFKEFVNIYKNNKKMFGRLNP